MHDTLNRCEVKPVTSVNHVVLLTLFGLVFSVLGCSDVASGIYSKDVILEVGLGDRQASFFFPHQTGSITINLLFDSNVLPAVMDMDHFEDGVLISEGESAGEIIYGNILGNPNMETSCHLRYGTPVGAWAR